jgi:hypothetical protein
MVFTAKYPKAVEAPMFLVWPSEVDIEMRAIEEGA